MKVVLCGLTGLGNAVFHALIGNPNTTVCAVFTRRYKTPYPYYPIEQLCNESRKYKITTHTNAKLADPSSQSLIRAWSPDLIIVAGFHQILPSSVIDIPRFGAVNFHPSLLPRYRGAVPEQTALLQGDSETGITLHYLTSELDAGDILLQRTIPILSNDTISTLRMNLAKHAAQMVPELVELFANTERPVGVPQRGSPTYAHKTFNRPVYLDLKESIDETDRKVRALSAFPGTLLQKDGRCYQVTESRIFCSKDKQARIFGTDIIEIHSDDRTLLLTTVPFTQQRE